ncbi:MAG: hypothetical protein AAF620_02185 [Bacteroidota bacterium]
MQWFLSLLITVTSQTSGWEIFSETRFKWEYRKELGLQVEIPIFDEEIKELEGKEILLTGHYLPLNIEGNRIIISKLPYASCFFCGGGVGQESVAEVIFNSAQRPFRGDELVTVKGRLRLNKDDYEHLVFILEDARVIQL